MCAFGVPGVRTSVADTPGGVDVRFVVIGDASELRRRAHGAVAGTYPIRPESRAVADQVYATVTDDEDGLQMHMTPRDPTKVDVIRDDVRHLLDDVRARGCD